MREMSPEKRAGYEVQRVEDFVTARGTAYHPAYVLKFGTAKVDSESEAIAWRCTSAVLSRRCYGVGRNVDLSSLVCLKLFRRVNAVQRRAYMQHCRNDVAMICRGAPRNLRFKREAQPCRVYPATFQRRTALRCRGPEKFRRCQIEVAANKTAAFQKRYGTMQCARWRRRCGIQHEHRVMIGETKNRKHNAVSRVETNETRKQGGKSNL